MFSVKSKKIFIVSTTACFIIIGFALFVTTYAAGGISANSSASEEIDRAVRGELSKAKTPYAAVSAVQGEDVMYFAYSDTGGEPSPDTRALFQIGSLSKAYTGLAILLLEDDGFLSLDDPVSKYLPWFTVFYDGRPVPHEEFTISNLLYQTSGFTNNGSKYPGASNGMSIEESVRQINGSELTFYPSRQFAYANINYRLLGLIIEVISGQSYDAFMTEHILLPLGLESTYTDPQKAKNTGLVVEGSRLSFLRAWPYDVPVAEGNVPAGFIYSNVKDMSRWLQIQMEEIEVAEQFQKIIKKAHQPNPGSVVDDNTHYAAGWFINDETGEIYHPGSTPCYSTHVAIRPQRNVAVCALTNMNAAVNIRNIATNTLNILEGKPVTTYQVDIWMIFDLIFSGITIAGIIGTAPLICLTYRLIRQIRNGQLKKMRLTRKRLLTLIPASLLTLLTISFAVILPIIFESSWMVIPVWAPLSLLSGMVSLVILSLYAFGIFLFPFVK